MMKTIKIINLYNLIANKEFDKLPKKIKTGNIIWNYNREANTYFMNDTTIELFYAEEITKKLNDEVEILEEPKKIPEKLNILTFSDLIDMPKEDLVDVIIEQRFKINEILDYLKSKGE